METAMSDLGADNGRSGQPPFVFVGEALPLDLVNTEQILRGKPIDLLVVPNDVAVWWHAAADHFPGTLQTDGLRFDDALLAETKAFRAALRGIFEAVADGVPPPADALVRLNRVLRVGCMMAEPDESGRVRSVLRSYDRGPLGVLVPIAHAALSLLTERDPVRLHRCGNARCVLLFNDTTKSATRRWCSLGCMNRARSVRRYRERREARAPTTSAT